MFRTLLFLFVIVLAYLATWPVPIEPMKWQPPENEGYRGRHASNNRLARVTNLNLDELTGPEAITLDPAGKVYASTDQGWIVRVNPDGTDMEKWIHVGGRPLGIAFDAGGNLYVANAYLGLQRILPTGEIHLVASQVDGSVIGYANDVDVAPDGKVYFSDASKKFSPLEHGGTYAASILDILEHAPNGRLLVYDPQTNKTETLLEGLHFANGVAVSPANDFVLISETASYRIRQYWLSGPTAGSADVLIENLPGFPDNITRGTEGKFWVALISPRNAVLDELADKPFLRTMLQRLPEMVRPRAGKYGHIFAMDAIGNVLADLQDARGSYPMITGVAESDEYLFLGSLVSNSIGRVEISSAR